ncbi:MAG: DEAD/DEAH box helicase, partial [Raoultibacter sp.]
MRFRERFELSIMGGDEDAAQRLRALVEPFMMRRVKTKVLRDLPDKLESVFYAHMEGEQRQLYVASEQQLRESLTEQRKNRKSKSFDARKVEILAELTKLRQLCCDPHLLYENYEGPAAKLDAVVELVESAIDAGEKVLVFSQFTSFLALIADRLDVIGAPYYTLTGATAKKKRLELVNAFNEDDTPVFLMSLKAGGTGLNLTGATIVIHADPWWNAAAQAQATDRAHRIGQTQVVSVYKVIAKDTIEERILRLQEAKSDLADRIIGSGNAGISLAKMTEDDLIELLQP